MPRMTFRSLDLPRGKAKALKAELSRRSIRTTLSRCQAAVAGIYGYSSWAEMKSVTSASHVAGDLSIADPEKAATVLAAFFDLTADKATGIVADVDFADVRAAGGRTLAGLVRRAWEIGSSDLSVDPDGTVSMRRFGRYFVDRMLPAHETVRILAEGIAGGTESRATFDMEDRWIDFRIAAIPVAGSVSLRIRILDPGGFGPALSSLGIARVGEWRKALARPNGLVIVCGPLRSGRTTTMRASVVEIGKTGKVLATEDILDGGSMSSPSPNVQVRSFGSRGDWNHVVRNFMLAAPKAIVLGETRSREEIDVALRAAETGHLVLVCMEAASILEAVRRLRSFGCDDDLLAANLKGVLCQALVPGKCRSCPPSPTSCRACRGLRHDREIIVSECVSFDRPEDVAATAAPGFVPFWSTMLDDAIERMRIGDVDVNEVRRLASGRVDAVDPRWHPGGVETKRVSGIA